jgi:hypothetical protein
LLGLTYGRSQEKVFLGTFFSFAGALIAEEYARLAPPENACCSLTLSRREENQYGHSFEEDDSPGDCRASLYARRLLHSLAPSLAASPEAGPLLLHNARSNKGRLNQKSSMKYRIRLFGKEHKRTLSIVEYFVFFVHTYQRIGTNNELHLVGYSNSY